MIECDAPACRECGSMVIKRRCTNCSREYTPDVEELRAQIAAEYDLRADTAQVVAFLAVLRSGLEATGSRRTASWAFEYVGVGVRDGIITTAYVAVDSGHLVLRLGVAGPPWFWNFEVALP